VFFEADQSRVLVVRVLHDRMDYQRQLDADAGPDKDRRVRSSRTPQLVPGSLVRRNTGRGWRGSWGITLDTVASPIGNRETGPAQETKQEDES
jgi:hypothetical protein